MCLEVINLRSRYIKEKYVLDGVTFTAQKGKVNAILGINGAGKTTLLNILAGIHENYDGEIFIDGKRIHEARSLEVKRKKFYIGDEAILFDEMSALQFIEYIHVIYKRKIDEVRLRELAEAFNFEKYLFEDCGKLSLGNRQKTLLITALLIQCEILILDEPLLGLDVMAIENFYKEIRNYAKEGRIVIFSTHIIEVVNNISDKVFLLDKGRIKESFDVGDQVNIKAKFFEVINDDGGI
ncbi:MAG: ABC transporter ATP-binding protein [Clostridiaceae bacterium]|nr:ABC transporter ATP-binding protein [Clostridiaceae bacterium]